MRNSESRIGMVKISTKISGKITAKKRPPQTHAAIANVLTQQRMTVGVRPRPQYLSKEFGVAGPPFKTHPAKMDHRQKRYILWARWQGIRVLTISRDLGYSKRAIDYFLYKAKRDAAIFLIVEFVMALNLGPNHSDRYWFCRGCGEMHKILADAANHAYSHVFLLPMN